MPLRKKETKVQKTLCGTTLIEVFDLRSAFTYQ